MRLRSIALVAAPTVLAVTPAALGAGDDPGGKGAASLAWFVLMASFVIVLCLIVVVIRKSGTQGRYMTKADGHMDRNAAHMASIEQKSDRMIELLESINRKLGERA